MMLQKPLGEIETLMEIFTRYLHEQFLIFGFAFNSRTSDGYDLRRHGSLCGSTHVLSGAFFGVRSVVSLLSVLRNGSAEY